MIKTKWGDDRKNKTKQKAIFCMRLDNSLLSLLISLSLFVP